MKTLKLLLSLVFIMASITICGCGDEANGMEGWYTHNEGAGAYCFINIKGRNFNYYHYAQKGKEPGFAEKEVSGKSGWYCQSLEKCLFYVEGDYIILDNGKKATIDGNTINYFNRSFRKD